MGKISEESIRKVIESTDIVALIGNYTPLKKAGTLYKGCCPFHNEKTPSFTVSPSRQTYKCFGCGEGGGAITFIRKYENLSFSDALRKLADLAHIHLIEENYTPEQIKKQREKHTLGTTIKSVAEWYHQQLLKSPDAEKARQYLKNRGFSSSMVKNWQIGWAPENNESFLKWARSAKLKGGHLVKTGICYLRNEANPNSGLNHRFRERLMFPIANDYGEIIAFSGRLLEERANAGKYVNSPETELFKKSNVLFGLNKARQAMTKQGYALICEGQIDVIACHEAGFTHAVAGLGTAFTNQHAKLLRRYTTKATLCFDGDAAGIKAADRAFKELASEGITVRLVSLPPKDDPDSFIKRDGADAFYTFINEAKSFFDVHIQRAQQSGIIESPELLHDWIDNITDLIAYVPDPIYRDNIITTLCMRLHLSKQDVTEEVTAAIKEHQRIKKLESQRARIPIISSSTPNNPSSNPQTPVKKSPILKTKSAPPPLSEDDDIPSHSDDEPTPDFISDDDEGDPDLIPDMEEPIEISEDGDAQEEQDWDIPLDMVRPLAIERPIQQLIELSLQFADARDILQKQLEDIIEALENLRGGLLLKKILSTPLDVDSPLEVQIFINQLPLREQAALNKLNLELPEEKNFLESINNNISVIAKLNLIKKQENVVQQLKNTELTVEERTDLFLKLVELQKLLTPDIKTES